MDNRAALDHYEFLARKDSKSLFHFKNANSGLNTAVVEIAFDFLETVQTHQDQETKSPGSYSFDASDAIFPFSPPYPW